MRRMVYRQKLNRCGEERGFSLLEVLLSMVFLAIGLLAIAAMQDVAMGANMKAKRMSFATNLVTGLIEHIRYNAPANAIAPYPYNFTVTCTSTACAGGAAPTTTNATAQGDYTQWKNRLGTLEPSTGQIVLPNASATVTSVATGSASLGQVLITIALTWTSGITPSTVTMSTIVAPL
ncbi:MAG TPA: type IV pilus modification protein PilV [Nitrospiraceae bacterium]|nr:type IV pilus modification protein PilV [Nitrospiraceae bacterium]